MDFKAATEYLDSLVSYEKVRRIAYNQQNFDLERFRNFLDFCGIDYGKLSYVHVAGSKGKGTVATLVADYLSGAGFQTGLFTSPFLIDVRESFVVNGRMISRKDFARQVEYFQKMIEKGAPKITYFELKTAIAFRYFIEWKVDFAVLEVGLGGRLDSTNVVRPKLAILTRVEREHTEILGETLAKIVREKLGIYKEGVPLVIGPQKAVVRRVIKGQMRGKKGIIFIENEGGRFADFDRAFEENACTVHGALEILLKKIDENLWRDVLQKFKLAGRFDVREVEGKTVVFDIAHTRNSIANLIDALVTKFPEKKFVFLFSMMKGKDVVGVLRLIERQAERVVFTSSHMQRGYTGEELGRLWIANVPKEVGENCLFEFRKVLKTIAKNEILVVTGSHFLVGKILAEIK